VGYASQQVCYSEKNIIYSCYNGVGFHEQDMKSDFGWKFSSDTKCYLKETATGSDFTKSFIFGL
jgi:hypothetical protein